MFSNAASGSVSFLKAGSGSKSKPDPDPHQTQNSGAVELKNRELEGLLLAVADFHHFDLDHSVSVRNTVF